MNKIEVYPNSKSENKQNLSSKFFEVDSVPFENDNIADLLRPLKYTLVKIKERSITIKEKRPEEIMKEYKEENCSSVANILLGKFRNELMIVSQLYQDLWGLRKLDLPNSCFDEEVNKLLKNLKKNLKTMQKKTAQHLYEFNILFYSSSKPTNS